MMPEPSNSLWDTLQQGNRWWPSYQNNRDDPLSWRHAAAIMLRTVDHEPVFAALPALFWELDDLTGEQVCHRLSGPISPIDHSIWIDVWLEHFTSWNDPVKQLIEQHCIAPEARRFADLLTRLDGIAFADFVLAAYEQTIFMSSTDDFAARNDPLPLLSADLTARPFVRLSRNYFVRFWSELGETATLPDDAFDEIDFNRCGGPALMPEHGR